jgi:hypothetical protein
MSPAADSKRGVADRSHSNIGHIFGKIPFDSGHEAAEPKRVILGDKSK